ncbi:hypothetical protein ABZ234_24860 [Nocardiopsis sp. NPDC006198]|uniref:hypothetical protein n=1 Tax=Nocardiopsis sp. NPDC006198 TaxID=3154472 RepID=UPI0033A39876
MQQAWAERDATAVIRLVRWNTDLSLTALVKLTGLAQSTLSDVISGKTVLKNLDKINTALEGVGTLRPHPTAHCFPDETTVTQIEPVGDVPDTASAGKLEDVKRRRFLEVAGTGAVTAPVLGLPDLRTDFATVHPRDLDQINQASTVFSGWDHTYGGSSARAAVNAHLGWAIGLLDRHIPTRLRSETFSAVARLAMVCGFMAFDAYAHDDARKMFAFATQAAEHADDWHLRAKILSHRSRQEIWCGDPDAGLTYAELALVRSDRLSPSEVAMLLTARARAFAKLGDKQQTLAAIGGADEAFVTESRVSPPVWMGYYDAAQHAGDTGHALWDLAVARLHPMSAAQERLQTAVEGHTDAYRRSRAISGIKLASLQMRTDPEQGHRTTLRALDDIGQVQSRRAEDDLRELATTTFQHSADLSRHITDRIEAHP